jgi:hypothetical protein
LLDQLAYRRQFASVHVTTGRSQQIAPAAVLLATRVQRRKGLTTQPGNPRLIASQPRRPVNIG